MDTLREGHINNKYMDTLGHLNNRDKDTLRVGHLDKDALREGHLNNVTMLIRNCMVT